MNRLASFFFVVISLLSIQIFAQTFTRTAEIKDPSSLEFGFGNILAGVDFDQDGMPEIYAVNANIDDRPYELTARIYKFEWNPNTATWDSVWGAIGDVPQQNTYPALTWGDIDRDGKPEIYWGPSNFLDPTINPNPYRVLVYEYPGDGSDNMGIDDGFGGFEANAKTKIITQDNFSVAPINFVIADPDNDGQDELIFSNQSAGANNFHVGILSVDDIPDNGGGTETWTLEYSGLNEPNLTGTGNKWDFCVVGPIIGLFNSNGKVSLLEFYNGNWVSYPTQSGVAGENSSFKGSVVVDFQDGSGGVYVGSWYSSKVYFIDKPENADTLVSYEVADFSPYAVRLQGAGIGDLDNDGNPDLVFGSRYDILNSAKVPVFRLEYLGGDKTNPASYQKSVIDSAYWDNNGDMGVICVANVDGDPEDEVLYTSQYPRGNPNLGGMPIIVIDLAFTPVSVEKENDKVPSEFYLDQNFPNPFNPTTEIKFGITEGANIDLRIYDALGREVAVLISNEFMSGGSYNVKFDATKMASGTYVYRLTAGTNTVSRKMQLLK
ncbi:MAG TPA: hypothetical protein DHV28_19100 [Ignavibacteriales bacterium]|nr:hypothetical protein [Ignavibacteriales bacterium]